MLFIGSTRAKKLIARSRSLGWGRLFVEKPSPQPGEPWALDNGVFGAWRAEKPWSAAAFLRSLEQSAALPPPDLAVLPDKVGAGAESIAWSMAWLAVLPSRPWFLAVQDGMTVAEVEAVIPKVSGLFLGGTDAFKATAQTWCDLAHAHGKKFHYARVSTRDRLKAAFDCGADSADSSQMLWSDDHWRRFECWWREIANQTSLFARTA